MLKVNNYDISGFNHLIKMAPNSSFSSVQTNALVNNNSFPISSLSLPVNSQSQAEPNPKKLEEKIKEYIIEFLPFLNEVANVISHLKDEGKNWMLEWLYQESPKKLLPQISKYTIDFIALLGIGQKGLNKFQEYLKKGFDSSMSSFMALWEMGLGLIFSYIIPSFFLSAVQKSFGKKFPILDKPFGRFLTGILIGVGSLELGYKLSSEFLTPLFEKAIIWLKNKVS